MELFYWEKNWELFGWEKDENLKDFLEEEDLTDDMFATFVLMAMLSRGVATCFRYESYSINWSSRSSYKRDKSHAKM